MHAHGLRADVELLADLAVGQALCEQGEHLELARGELGRPTTLDPGMAARRAGAHVVELCEQRLRLEANGHLAGLLGDVA